MTETMVKQRFWYVYNIVFHVNQYTIKYKVMIIAFKKNLDKIVFAHILIII